MLAGEAGFTLEQKLVENFISSVQRSQGVSPVDIAIGVLSLTNFVQQRGSTRVGMAEYELAGGADEIHLCSRQFVYESRNLIARRGGNGAKSEAQAPEGQS